MSIEGHFRQVGAGSLEPREEAGAEVHSGSSLGHCEMPEGGQSHQAYSECPDLKSEPTAAEVEVDMSAFLRPQYVLLSELGTGQ